MEQTSAGQPFRNLKKIATDNGINIMACATSICDLIGKRIATIENVGGSLVFNTTGGCYVMNPDADDESRIWLEDICGDVNDVIGPTIVFAEEISNSEWPGDVPKEFCYETCTWTFYRIATQNGMIIIRWCGTSNGYNSEAVKFEKIHNP